MILKESRKGALTHFFDSLKSGKYERGHPSTPRPRFSMVGNFFKVAKKQNHDMQNLGF